MVRIILTFCVFVLFSSSCLGADSPSKCFKRFVGYKLPFEIFTYDDWSTKYIQTLEDAGEASSDDVPFIKPADQVSVTPLCDGNFVAVWTYQHHRFPVPLTGRIFDSKFRPIHSDFAISDKTGVDEWEHSVSTLYDDGFIVTWKTWKTKARKEIKLRGRLFDSAGNPKGKSFEIYSKGNNAAAFVYGLPKGGFVVVWNNYVTGDTNTALLRIFNHKGKPITKEITIASGHVGTCWMNPRAHLTIDGKINVFIICDSWVLDPNHSVIYYARSFSVEGKPLTGVLIGNEMLTLQGFNTIKNKYLEERSGLKAERKGD